nr:hypothetical protein CFP56_04279 [Quercus suber]
MGDGATVVKNRWAFPRWRCTGSMGTLSRRCARLPRPNSPKQNPPASLKFRADLLLVLDLLLVHDDDRLALDLAPVHHLHELLDLVQPVKRIRLDAHAMFRDALEHAAALVRRADQRAMDLDVAEDDLGEGDLDGLRLRDLHHDAVHLGDGASQARGGRRVRDADGAVGAAGLRRRGVHRLHARLLALTRVDDDVRAVLLAQREPFVPRVDADDLEPQRLGELDAEMTESVRSERRRRRNVSKIKVCRTSTLKTSLWRKKPRKRRKRQTENSPSSRSDDAHPLALLEPRLQHAAPDRAAGARERRGAQEADGVGQLGGGAGVDAHVLGEAAVEGDADHALDVGAVLALVLRPAAVGAAPARVHGDAAHDAVAGREGRGVDGGADGDDGAAALVRGDERQRAAEHAGLHHAVRVAVRGHGDFDQEVGRRELGGHRHGGEAVRLVELGDLDGLHLRG